MGLWARLPGFKPLADPLLQAVPSWAKLLTLSVFSHHVCNKEGIRSMVWIKWVHICEGLSAWHIASVIQASVNSNPVLPASLRPWHQMGLYLPGRTQRRDASTAEALVGLIFDWQLQSPDVLPSPSHPPMLHKSIELDCKEQMYVKLKP